MLKESEFIKLNKGDVPDEFKAMVDEGSALFIPIGLLENMLDALEWSTTNFQHSLYKDGYANLCVAASLELVVMYDAGTRFVRRTFVGACNFPLSSLEPNTHFLATAKSECIKNAASDIGKYFGRGLNDNTIPSSKKMVKVTVKSKPDSKIMQQFLKAVEEKDEATIKLLTNIYNIQTEENA